ncbi:hypothetical protein [Devriesea agamarum]|uniref:hypothetical protein n=1 Tax=Devriesea agamarum TaxID=472569 RepID=UPI00071C3F80|nr:hypothetical protein [Devriesea agamarum]
MFVFILLKLVCVVLRFYLRFSCVIFALMLGFFTVTVIQQDEAKFPMGTQQSLTLMLDQSQALKSEVAQSLDAVAQETGISLYKDGTGLSTDQGDRTLIGFGRVSLGKIPWFSPGGKGAVVGPHDIGDAPLGGRYVTSECDASCQEQLSTWAKGHGAEINWGPIRSLHQHIQGFLLNTGTGMALISAILLVIAAFIALTSASARTNNLLLMGGVSLRRIQARATISPTQTILAWSACGAAICCGWIIATRGAQHIQKFLSYWLVLAALFIGVMVVIVALSARVFRPSIGNVAARRVPLVKLRIAGIGVRLCIVILVAVMVPYSLTMLLGAQAVQKQAERWNNVGDAVSVSFLTAIDDAAYRASFLENLNRTMDSADVRRNLLLSLPLDRNVEVPPSALGEYDHIVIVSESFLRQMNYTGNGAPTSKKVDFIDGGNLSPELSGMLYESLQILVKDPSQISRHIRYAAIPGVSDFPILGHGYTSASNPLLLVVDDPVSVFKTEAFLEPAIASGNLVFSQPEQVKTVFARNGVTSMVSSVDSVAASYRIVARQASEQVRDTLAGIAVAVLSVGISAIQGAGLWAGARRRLIFARHSFGVSYLAISARALLLEGIVAAFAAAIALLVAWVQGLSVDLIIASSIAVPLIYIGLCVACYRFAAHAAFRTVVGRHA